MEKNKFDYSKVDAKTAKKIQAVGKEISTLLLETKEKIEEQIKLSKSVGLDIKDVLSEEEKEFYEEILRGKL